jgi:hypothetical protein
LWVVGFVILLLVGALLLVQAVLLMARGRHGAATRVISTRSAAEEVEDEIRFIKERESGGER